MKREFVFSVHQLTRYLKALLAQEETLTDVSVRGEISDLTRHHSGHIYFTLKDATSRLQCVLFREHAQRVNFDLETGLEVIARGEVTVYEARGQYQLLVRILQHAGVGDLFLAFEQLRRKLAAEGLFDEARKRMLPRFPRRIALVTSPIGAAVHDVLRTLRQRWPVAGVVLIPTAVSGAAAANEIAQAVSKIANVAGAEVALIVRGGGSMEELAGFNDEAVARAIAACPIPVITGLGHETDVTIADFAADYRAPTPTGAAVAATPDRSELTRRVAGCRRRAAERLQRMLERSRRELLLLRARPALARPGELVRERRQLLDDETERIRRGVARMLEMAGNRFHRAREMLSALRPQAVLARGYSITRLPHGAVVRSARQLAVGTPAQLTFAEGSAEVTVQRTMLPAEE